MVALIKPSDTTPRPDLPPRFAALVQEREHELELLAYMLSHGAAYREAELLGLGPADFVQSSAAGSKSLRDRDGEQTVPLVADHIILAEAIALSRTERMSIYEAIEEICHVRLAKTRNPIDRYRLEVQREAVPALIDKLRGMRGLTADEFQRRARSLKRLRDALADDEEPVTPKAKTTTASRQTALVRSRPSPRSAEPIEVVPLRRPTATRETPEIELDDTVAPEADDFRAAPPTARQPFQPRVVEPSAAPPPPANSAPRPGPRLFRQSQVKAEEYVPNRYHQPGEQSPGAGALMNPTYPRSDASGMAPPDYQMGYPPAGAPASFFGRPRIPVTPGVPLPPIEPLSNMAETLAEQLFALSALNIATPAAALNEVFNGGWSRGKLYVLAGAPESGKTTFCAWSADYAASQQVPILYVSFELSKTQLWLRGLARTARLDSRGIEGQRWLTGASQQGEHLRRQVEAAIKDYGQLAQFLNVVEAQPGITAADLRPAIARVRAHYGLPSDAPILVIVDSLASLLSGLPDIDFSGDSELKMGQVVAGLKQLARETGTAVLATVPTSGPVSAIIAQQGEVQSELLRQEPWFHSAADTVMLLTSNEISGSDQLQLLINRYRDNEAVVRRLRQIRDHNPSDPAGQERSTYARVNVVKNRDGARSELIWLYQRAFHNFVPFDLLLELSR